jgi:23S rRNA (adenine2503-C2)-methyltransferase
MSQTDRSTVQLYDLDFSGLQTLLKDWGEPAYRAHQIWEWLYVHLADSFDQMTKQPNWLTKRR